MLLHDLHGEQDHGEERRELRRFRQAEGVLDVQIAFGGGAVDPAAAKIENRREAARDSGHHRERHEHMRKQRPVHHRHEHDDPHEHDGPGEQDAAS